MDAWVLRAKGRRPGATVLHVHGGPYNSHGPVPWLEMVALAGAGINVVWANPTGSTSYGEAFARRLVGHWGEPDGEDLLAAVDWAIAERIADPSRIGIMGLSYGGFMVNRLLGRHPGRFAAAVSENPVTDLVSFAGESDLGWFAGSRGAGLGTPEAKGRRYHAGSPWREIARNRAPVLFLQSEADLRCPPGQTELVFSIMRRSGVETEMVRYPEEPHYLVGVGRPDRRADRIDRVVAWFSDHL